MTHSTDCPHTDHIPEETLALLRRGALTPARRDAVLSHLSCCPACAAAFAGGYIDTELLPLPSDFTREAVRRQATSGKRDGYALRVCAAVAAALMLLFVRPGEFPKIPTPPDLSFVQTASEQLRDFSDRLLNLEALRHD